MGQNRCESYGRTFYLEWQQANKEAGTVQHYADLDPRLCQEHLCMTWGLTAAQAARGANGMRAADRLQKMVKEDPSCMDVDRSLPFGEYFHPMDEAWLMGQPDEKFEWKHSLCDVLTSRISSLICGDFEGLITGLVDCRGAVLLQDRFHKAME